MLTHDSGACLIHNGGPDNLLDNDDDNDEDEIEMNQFQLVRRQRDVVEDLPADADNMFQER